MKNFLLKGRCSILCGLLIVASCNESSKMSRIFSLEDNEIRFGSNGVRVESKSFVETTNSLLQANGFKAAVVVDVDNSVMFNATVAYDSTDAVYRVPDEHYYYPSEGTVSIYGVYPSSEIISVSSGEATVTYAQNPDEDLVGAKAVAVERQSTPVLMEFEHLLSQVTMTVKTDNPNTVCKLYDITLADADGGIYVFADDDWILNETAGVYTIFSSPSGESVTTVKADVGEAMSFMPGGVALNVKWKCFNKVSGNLVSDNDQTVYVGLAKGKHYSLNLTLPSNSSEIALVTTTEPWVEVDRDIEVKPQEFVFTVNNSGKKVKFSPGNLYFDGSEFCFEEHQYDFPADWDPNHIGHFFWSGDADVAIAENYGIDVDVSADDTFFAANGGAVEGYTVLSKNEWQYLAKNSFCSSICKNVKAYNDDDYFFSFTGTYEQAKAAFAANSAAKKYYSGQSFDDLLEEGIITEKKTAGRNIAGVGCAVLTPDGFDGAVKEVYTAKEWETAEKQFGLVALPFAGFRMYDSGIMVYTQSLLWASDPKPDAPENAWSALFASGSNISYNWRYNGYSVRLVQVQ